VQNNSKEASGPFRTPSISGVLDIGRASESTGISGQKSKQQLHDEGLHVSIGNCSRLNLLGAFGRA